MRSKHIFVETCILIVFLHLIHLKVLCENLPNFRSLSYEPDQVALEIKEMQNGYSAPRYRAKYGAYDNAFTTRESEVDNIQEIKLRSQKKNIRLGTIEDVEDDVKTEIDTKKRFAVKDVVIDFDELVNKVKEKLKDELNQKKKDKDKVSRDLNKKLRNNPDMDASERDNKLPSKNIYESNDEQEKANEPREAWKQFMTTKSPKTVIVTTNSHTSRGRKPMKKFKKKTQANYMVFEAADLTKVKDSYEDYVTPKRVNMYASDTETETLNPIPKQKYEEESKENYKENEERNEPKEKEEINEELQRKSVPKISELLKSLKSPDRLRKIKKLDDPIDLAKDDYDPRETMKPMELTEKVMFVNLGDDSDDEPVKLKGTMIPTRHFFKMSSPNYFAKLPVVAEKYDFKEPLPDKDREPENLKYFFNPPASINRKVKLQ